MAEVNNAWVLIPRDPVTRRYVITPAVILTGV
jgi:hypothetical protein